MIVIRERALSAWDAIGHAVSNLKSASFAVNSDRLRNTLVSHDLTAERSIAVFQLLIAGFILALHIIAQLKAAEHHDNIFVPVILALFIAASMVRRTLVDQHRFTEVSGDVLTFIDISLFVLLIWSFQYPYDLPAGSSLKAPSFSFLYLLVALRVFRFHPRPILIAGSSAVFGWLGLTFTSVAIDGQSVITSNYVEYLTSHKILIGAELEKAASLILLMTFLAIATAQARRILAKAAHSDDYLEALSKAESNLQQLAQARSELKQALHQSQEKTAQLATQNQRFDRVLENMGEGVCMFDGDRRLVVCNSHYAAWYQLPDELVKPGAAHDDVIAHRVSNGILRGETSDAAVKDKIESLERHSKNAASSRVDQLADGRYICVTRQPLPDGGWVATHQDVTEQHEARAKISHMALHDPLTNLPNRVTLSDRLERAMARVRRGEKIALHLLDLDHFKNVNDTLGHPIGDKLLIAVTERLNRYVREVDSIARMGGDEFAIVQVAIDRPEDAEALAERIIETISAPYEIDGHNVVVGTSIGIAVAPSDGTDADVLTRNADLALYRAKSSGRRTHSFFEPEMDKRMQDRRMLEYELRQGLIAGEFELYYQPIVRLQDQQVSGFEALLRWHHPTRGLVSPGDFVPLAEETGLINHLGEWILYEACRTAASWPENLSIAINISPIQFRASSIVDQVFSALDCSGLAPSRLVLEITEAVLLEHKESTLETLSKFQERGVRIAMDDFGTGYSSLSYLQTFPFDTIKIDRSFVKNLEDNSGSVNIVRAIASMAEGMNISTTAEGVETAEQLDRVRAEGCSEIQGFLVSKPLPANEVAERFIHNKADPLKIDN